jgi:hypothetical protein
MKREHGRASLFWGKLGKRKIERVLPNADMDRREQERELRQEMEKGDLPAIILAAFLTLWPILLILGGVLGLLYWWAVG